MLESLLSRWSFAEITSPHKNFAKERIWFGPCLSGLLNHTPSQSFPHRNVDAKVPPLLSRYFKVHYRRSALNPVKLLPCRGETPPKFLGALDGADLFEALELRRPAGRVHHLCRRRSLKVAAGEETRWEDKKRRRDGHDAPTA